MDRGGFVWWLCCWSVVEWRVSDGIVARHQNGRR